MQPCTIHGQPLSLNIIESFDNLSLEFEMLVVINNNNEKFSCKVNLISTVSTVINKGPVGRVLVNSITN